jgi:ribosomal protein S18 acetylase RimI-like enzyme
MSLSSDLASQIADLLNLQNKLMTHYTPAKILEYDRYIVRVNAEGKLLGVVEIRKVQWYQCEIDHLSVDPSAKRQGIGTSLIQEAEDRARQLGARVAQCTIREGNKESEGLFKKCGYVSTLAFINEGNGNLVTVYLKVL